MKLVYWPDKRLREICFPVTSFDDELVLLVEHMKDVMAKHGGLGLAANQVGSNKRVVIVTVDGEPQELINPTLIAHDVNKSIVLPEGCLSFPGYYQTVFRYRNVVVQYFDCYGVEKTIDTAALDPKKNPFTSICIQHELDHLDGRTFLDYLSELKANRAKKAVQKYKKRMGIK